MQTESRHFAHDVDLLVTAVRDLLDSSDARNRVRAVHFLATGIAMLERRVLTEAQGSGMTWAEIGSVYGVSRQAVHRRFADETVVLADFFDELLASLDEAPEVVSALAHAGKRARHAAETR